MLFIFHYNLYFYIFTLYFYFILYNCKWSGYCSSFVIKHILIVTAAKAAKRFKETYNFRSIIFVDDGYEKTLAVEDIQGLDMYLPLNKRIVKPASIDLEDDLAEGEPRRSQLKLYHCSEASGKYRVTEVKSGPLKQSDLNSDDVFIVDNNTFGIYVWVGKKAPHKERQEAIRNARGFVKKKKYPNSVNVTRVVDGAEPYEFKMLFPSWKEREEQVGLIKGLRKPLPVVKVTKYDAETLFERQALAARSQLLDDGSGTIQKFMVKNNTTHEIPKERNSVFFTYDCYVVR